jgi:hypothetical protein
MWMRVRSLTMRSHGPLAAIMLAVLVASCGGRPAVTVRVAGEIVPTQVTSTTEGTPCSTSHGDGPFSPRLTIVRVSTPITIRVDVDPGTQVRGWIYDVDGPTPTGGPLEEFTLAGTGTHQSRSIVAARTYNVLVNVARSVMGFRSEVTHAFSLRVEPP